MWSFHNSSYLLLLPPHSSLLLHELSTGCAFLQGTSTFSSVGYSLSSVPFRCLENLLVFPPSSDLGGCRAFSYTFCLLPGRVLPFLNIFFLPFPASSPSGRGITSFSGSSAVPSCGAVVEPDGISPGLHSQCHPHCLCPAVIHLV